MSVRSIAAGVLVFIAASTHFSKPGFTQSAPQSPTNLRIIRDPADSIPPTVSITAPLEGASVSALVTLSAAATDNVGVSSVQFFVDGLAVGPEDQSAPFTVSWDTASVGNGTHTVSARARDVAGNHGLSAGVTVSVQNPGNLQISSISAPMSVSKYDKFEITFQVTGTVAVNNQMPFDENPPAGIPSNWGITVDAHFSRDNFQTVFVIPGFYYQYFDYQLKANRDWLGPLDQYAWKVRFSPHQEGTWQYRLIARDASGSVTSPIGGFLVSPSSLSGFLRVSPRDARYFEFADGRVFLGLGYNGGIDWSNPISASTSSFGTMRQNGIDLSRIWLTQSGIFGSAWNPWYGLRGDYGGYIPRTGLTPAGSPARVKMRLTYAEDTAGQKNTGYFEACRFLGGFQAATAVKRNTNYHFTVRYTAFDITGPRIANFPNFGFVLKMQNPSDGNWHRDCYEPGTLNSTGQVISRYATDSSGEMLLEGDWYSGNNDFLPPFYMALENVRATNPATGRAPAVYVSGVEIRERPALSSMSGPNIVPKPSMEHQNYFEQRFSFAFDRIIDAAEQNGIFLKVVILEKDEDILNWLDPSGNFVAANSNNFYGSYRTMTAGRWLQRAWWRYLQARWGYSVSIHSWELINEGDPSNDRHYVLADELGKFMRQFAPNHHLVTTSFWHSLPATAFWKNPSYTNIDYADLHAYVSTSQITEFSVAAAKDPIVRLRCGTSNACFKASMKNDAALYHSEHSLQALDRALGMPLVRGEAGLNPPSGGLEDVNLTRDIGGTWLHNFVWSSIDGGGMYDLYWWLENILRRPGPDGLTGNGLREIYKQFKDFLSGIPLSNGHYRNLDATVSNVAGVRVLGQRDTTTGRAHAWIQNRKHIWCAKVGGVPDCPYVWDGSRLSGTVTITGFPPHSTLPAQWLLFNTDGVSAVSEATVLTNSDGSAVINLDTLPSAVTDAALKIGAYP